MKDVESYMRRIERREIKEYKLNHNRKFSKTEIFETKKSKEKKNAIRYANWS